MTLPPVAIQKLEGLEKRVQELSDKLADPEVAVDPNKTRVLAKERGELDRTVGPFQQWRALERRLEEARALAKDPEMGALAGEEIAQIEPQISALESKLLDRLLVDDLPGNPDQAILEIRAGTGGDEAALFAMDLFQMYRRFIETQGWKVE